MDIRKLIRPKLRWVLAITLAVSGRAIAAKGGRHGNGGNSGGTTSVFTVVGKLQVQCSYHTASKLVNDRVLLAGGLNHYVSAAGESIINNSAEIYNPVTKSFSSVAPMNIPRMYHSATLLADGRVLVSGGISQTDFVSATIENTAELYDPADNSWTLLPAVMTDIRYKHTATLLPDGNVLLSSNAKPSINGWYGFGDNTA